MYSVQCMYYVLLLATSNTNVLLIIVSYSYYARLIVPICHSDPKRESHFNKGADFGQHRTRSNHKSWSFYDPPKQLRMAANSTQTDE